MGAFLEKPITEKVTQHGEGTGVRYGVSAMQGWRKEMEDQHVCNTNFKLKEHAFFGVFDGHAGAKASVYCSKHLLDSIMDCLGSSEPNPEELKKAIREGFLKLDSTMKQSPGWEAGDNRGGTTAITVMLTPDKIIFGNCGDSRGLLCRGGKLEFMTKDHKPNNEGERKRIEAAGGSVMMQRVNGSLAVSRALGDFEFKQVPDKPDVEQLVSPEPEVTVLDRNDDSDEFLLLACDGVYDVMTNEEIVKFISKKLKITDDLSKICSDLIDTCLHKNSRDNMSAILITFKGAPKVSEEAIAEEEKLQKRVEIEIEKQLAVMVEAASDPLELEESEVMARLSELLADELPDYNLAEKRPLIASTLANKKKEKFGESQDLSESYEGSSDMFFHRLGGTGVFIAPETDSVSALPPKSSETSMEGERPSDNLPSPVQTDSSQSA